MDYIQIFLALKWPRVPSPNPTASRLDALHEITHTYSIYTPPEKWELSFLSREKAFTSTPVLGIRTSRKFNFPFTSPPRIRIDIIQIHQIVMRCDRCRVAYFGFNGTSVFHHRWHTNLENVRDLQRAAKLVGTAPQKEVLVKLLHREFVTCAYLWDFRT